MVCWRVEGDALARLHHQNIVAHRETLTVAGRTALLLKSAGSRTLAEKLKEELQRLKSVERGRIVGVGGLANFELVPQAAQLGRLVGGEH